MSAYTAKFLKTLDEIIDRDYRFGDYSRIYWLDYGPMNIIPSDTRFCSKNWNKDEAVFYAASNFETAFCETLIRNNFDRRIERRLERSMITKRGRALIESAKPLAMIDLTDANCQKYAVPVTAIRGGDHRSGRAFARAIIDKRKDVDGILFPSRLKDGSQNIAVFNRALKKLAVTSKKQLKTMRRTYDLIEDYNIELIPDSGSKDA